MPMTTRARKLPVGFWAKTTTAKKRRATRPRASKALTAAVQKIVKRGEETKVQGYSIEDRVSHNAAISNADIAVVMGPGMTQGTTSQQRVGDKISPVSLVVSGATSLNDYGQGYIDVPITVKVMCLQAKGIKDSNLVTANADIANLMENGGTSNWDGSTLKSLWKVNTDDFQVLGSRTFKLGDATAENTKCMTHRWSMSIKCPKTLLYSPGSIYPSNFAPFFVLGWCRDDGQTPTSTQVYIVNSANVRFSYKDA